MRNLKRALCLALAAVMVIGLMVVGAGAVSYNDLTDKDEIVNKDAVSMLVALDIIQGMPDGSYSPSENVDRAQMAKMLSVIMNKGVDNSTLYQSVNSGLTDIDSNWAKGHINYCYTTGIIAGRGDGTFDPDATVTALEAAKMLLVAVGYDPEIEGFTGADWALNVSVRADALGIFDGFTKDLTAPLNRDDAALLIYNALDVEMIQSYTTNNYPIAYSDHRTILSDKYGVIKVEGVVTANEWAVLDDDSDTALQEGKTRIYNPDGILSTTGNTTVSQSSDANVNTQVFNVSTPVDMLGKTVTMYIKKTTILANSTVYGEPVVSDVNTVIETGAKVTGGTTKDDNSLASLLKGTGLATDRSTEYYLNYAEVAIDSTDTDDVMNVKGAALTVIDNDNDGYVDYVISVQKDLTHISAVSTKNDTTTIYGLPGDDVIDNADIVTSDDLEKGDVVLVVQYGGRTYVEIPETITGEMELFNAKYTDPNKNYIQIDGEQYNEDGLKVLSAYKPSENPVKFWLAGCEGGTDVDGVHWSESSKNVREGVQFDATYDFYLDDFGNIIAFREVEGAPTQYALVLDSAYSINGLTTTGQIKLLLADGTSAVYDVDMDATADKFEAMADDNDGDTAIELWFASVGGGNTINDDNAMKAVLAFMGTDDPGVGVSNTNERGYAAGNLVAYSIDDDGLVTFQPADLDLGTWVDGTSTTYNKNGFFAPQQPNDSAVLASGHDLENGDVDLYWRLDGKTDTTTSGSYGIDEDTIIYYYDGSKGTVVKGYDAMAKSIPAGGSGTGIDSSNVKVSVVEFDDGTDVAEVIVVYTSKAEFGNDDYVYVMSKYNKSSNNVYTYTVIDKEGNVFEMQSKTSGVAGKLCTYTQDGNYYKLSAQADGVAKGTANSTPSVANDVGLIVTTRTQYFKVYDFTNTVAGDLMADGETVEPTFVTGVEDGSNTDWMRYADKALVIDVDATDYDDDTAATTELTTGQYGIVVYDENKRAVVVYVTDTYKMEVDETTDKDSSDAADVLGSLTIGGLDYTNGAAPYSTARQAVKNATYLTLSDNQMGVGNNMAQIAATAANSSDYVKLWVYSNSDNAMNAVYATGTIAAESTTATLGHGTTIVIGIKDMDNNQAVSYYAYIVE